jgi:hypothetical protein
MQRETTFTLNAFPPEQTPAFDVANHQSDPSPKPASFSMAWREAIGKWFKNNLKHGSRCSQTDYLTLRDESKQTG